MDAKYKNRKVGNMLDKHTIIWTLLFMLVFVTAGVAQDHEVTGTVTDARTGETLPGVNILIKGTSQGTSTNMDGEYQIITELDDVLVFSYVGYETSEIAIEGRDEVNVKLFQSAVLVDELVVIGYGEQRKSDLSGSVSSITSRDFNKGVALSPNQLIQGKASGVNIVQTSGRPGGGSAISIRGTGSLSAGTDPLYVIDGLPIDNSAVVTESAARDRSPRDPLSSLNPQDIESIEILKDASATAIYGARGANGVILITTKDGQPGDLRVRYNSSLSIQNESKELEVLNAEEYRTFINDIIDKGAAASEQRVNEIQNGGTNWRDELMRNNAFMQNHNLSFSGGDENTTYMISLNVLDQEGLAISSALQNYGARINLDHNTERFRLGLKLNTYFSKEDIIPNGFSFNEGAGAFYTATLFDPTLSIFDEDGNFQSSPFLSLVDNPVAVARGVRPVSDVNRTFGSLFAEYEIYSGLAANLRVGGDIHSEQKDIFIGSNTSEGGALGGIGINSKSQKSNYLLEGLLKYQEDIELHSLNVIGGVTFQKFIFERLRAEGANFASDATGSNNLSLSDPTTNRASSFHAENSLLSFLARTNYSYKDKYLLSVSFRADGSSRFGENNKFGYFPAVSIGWRIAEEDFFSGINETINTLKPRISWGITGNQEIGNYNSLLTFSPGRTAFIDQQPKSTIDPDRIANPDLKWENNKQFNIGIDFGLYENRISGSLDWFKKTTSDMLLNLPIPTSTGFDSRFTNIGEMENTGIEFSLRTHNISKRNFSWRSTLNLSHVENEVTDLGPLDQILTGEVSFSGNMFLIKEGLPAPSYFGWEVVGVWQEGDDFSQIDNETIVPGNLKFRDVNNDGQINDDDKVVLGDSYPDFQFSVGNDFQYKNWQLNVFIESALGFEMINNYIIESLYPVNIRRNRLREPVLSRWTPENPSNRWPSMVSPFTQGEKKIHSLTVEDASYLKLQTVSLTYNFPSDFASRVFRNLSISLTGQNLLTITDYSGIDPAINPNGTAYSRIDFNAYPSATTFTLGVNLEF